MLHVWLLRETRSSDTRHFKFMLHVTCIYILSNYSPKWHIPRIIVFTYIYIYF